MTSLSQNQVVDLIESGENVRRDRPADSLVIIHTPALGGIPQETEDILVPDNDLDGEDRNLFLVRYSFIGSKITTVDETIAGFHLTAFAIFYRASNHKDFIGWAGRNGYKISKVPIDSIVELLDNIITANEWEDEFRALQEEIEIDKTKRSNALYGVYSCLLGKKLNTENCMNWSTNCVRALLGTVGYSEEGTNLLATFQFASSYNSRISVVKELRTIGYFWLRSIVKNGTNATWARDLSNAILLRLSWTELTGFRLIYTVLIVDKKYFWLWGWLACSCFEVLTALRRYLEYKEHGPYLKLITSNNENTIFNTAPIKRVAEVARLVGMINGQKSYANIKTGYNFPDEAAAIAGLTTILKAGDEGIFKWSEYAGERILPRNLNKKFWEVIENTDVMEQVANHETESSS